MSSFKSTSCSILGCGWLGFPLAKRMLEAQWKVKGSSTRKEKLIELSAAGIEPYQISLSGDGITGDISSLLDADILILNTPPGRNSDRINDYPTSIKHLIEALTKSPIKHVLFIGSTSVYGNQEPMITEESPTLPERPSGKKLLEVELALTQALPSLTILRFGGLVGPDRHPGRFLAGRKELPNPQTPVNLIHLEDCIGIILAIIQQHTWGETFNACADLHPSREKLYTHAAQQLGLPLPEFLPPSSSSGKIISNQKVTSALNYTFRFPDPMQMIP